MSDTLKFPSAANPTTTTISGSFSLENPTLQITTSKLNRSNFMEWSKSAKIFLKSKGKMNFMLGTSSPPADDPKFKA